MNDEKQVTIRTIVWAITILVVIGLIVGCEYHEFNHTHVALGEKINEVNNH